MGSVWQLPMPTLLPEKVHAAAAAAAGCSVKLGPEQDSSEMGR